MLPKFAPLDVPFSRYAHLSGIEQLKKFFAAIRDDGELSQIATNCGGFGHGRKTPILSLEQILQFESVADIETAIKDRFDTERAALPKSKIGAYFMANPVHDEQGDKSSVTKIKYLVWEGDEASLEEQYGAIVGSRLPIEAERKGRAADSEPNRNASRCFSPLCKA